MIKGGTTCPDCGGFLKYYDKVKRMLRTKSRLTYFVELRRLRCVICRNIHREITDDIFPYKRYEAELIRGVLEELITSDTLGYEDFPAEKTMLRWRSQEKQLL